MDTGRKSGVKTPVHPISGEDKDKKPAPKLRGNKAARDRHAMKQLRDQEELNMPLYALRAHLLEDHGKETIHRATDSGFVEPMLSYPVWDDLTKLEAAHDRLHESFKGHTHDG